ncbi:MAG TPA: hypothetical protein P5568_00095 [Acidobacteriota bacterium]|nr:hypothetical protein [Acidobacteriota bacterium]HRV06842.1 hypothetical protein [Acidobacteriota bacterium]
MSDVANNRFESARLPLARGHAFPSQEILAAAEALLQLIDVSLSAQGPPGAICLGIDFGVKLICPFSSGECGAQNVHPLP